MKICVATSKGGLEDRVSPVFGRAPTFTFVEVEDGKAKNADVAENPYAAAAGGAGIQAAQFVAGRGVSAVIAGNFGPKASMVLQQGNVKMVACQDKTVKEAVEECVKG